MSRIGFKTSLSSNQQAENNRLAAYSLREIPYVFYVKAKRTDVEHVERVSEPYWA